MSFFKRLPRNLTEDICFMAGYYESLIILGRQIFVDPRFKRVLFREGGPAKILEIILQKGADIRTLMVIKPLIPAYIALTTAISVTHHAPIIKRVCIVWNKYRCDVAFLQSKYSNFVWGIKNLQEELSYDTHDLNNAYVANKQFDKIDFTIDNPFEKVNINNWLYEQMGDKLFDGMGLYTLCSSYEQHLDDTMVYNYVSKRFNKDRDQLLDFEMTIIGLLRGYRFKQAQLLYENFEEDYLYSPGRITSYITKKAEFMAEYNLEKKQDYLNLMAFFNMPRTEIYRAILLLEVDNLLHYIRNEPDEIFTVFEVDPINCKKLLTLTPLLQQLTDDEFDRLTGAIFDSHEILPRSVNQNSSNKDIQTYYTIQTKETRIEMIKSGIMTDLNYIFQVFHILEEPDDNFIFAKAFTDLHGIDLIPSSSFHVYPCSKELFCWLADVLIETGHKGEAQEDSYYNTVYVSKGTAYYPNLSLFEQDWSDTLFDTSTPEYLKVHLAFWNYYEDQQMFFD